MTDRPRRILIVEDCPEDREAYRRALLADPAGGYEVRQTGSGEEGLRLARQDPPDCILLDHNLPDLDALEFLARLREGRPDLPVPVVVVTGQGSEAVAVRTMKAGADDYVVKGVAPDALRRAVAVAIDRHGQKTTRPYRVLIIDDSPEDREAYRRRLTGRAGERYEFQEAGTGEEGLRLARSFQPDCVLLDYQLPDMDGLEVLGDLTQAHGDLGLAVLMLTGQGSEAVAVRAMKLGAEDYLVKSRALEGLRQAVHTAVERVALRRQIRAQRGRLEEQAHLLDLAHVFTRDLEGRILYCSRGFTRLYGYPAGEAVGRVAHELLRTEFPRPLAALEADLLRDGEWQGELVHHRRDGSRVVVASHWAVHRNERGDPATILEVANDVTELRRAREQLVEADRRKDEFLAMLGHELRNPLAPMRNSLHLLRHRGGDRQTADHVREMMDRQVVHLGRLVDDLLDVSRITRGKFELRRERLDLGRLARDSAADHREAGQAAGVSVTAEAPDTPVWVSGDATRLTQVLDNLLANAVKFTPAGGRVAVRVASAGGRAVLTVEDTGIGIEPAVLPRVFDVFAQADRSLDRAGGGLGLGLAIVRGLVELHGGTVETHSAGPGQGARFTVSLPGETEPVPLAGRPPTAPPAGARQRVLVVEDNRDAADSLRMLLEIVGYEVRVAYTGPDGVRAARDWRPAAVVCDIGLPGLDGYGVATALRQSPETAGTKLIAVTGYGREEDRQRALASGFDDHLTKPADPDKLLRKLQAAGGQPV